MAISNAVPCICFDALSDAAGRPLASWQALQKTVAGSGSEGEAALSGATASA